MKQKIISHHAPSGHVAIKQPPGTLCTACAFKYESMCPNVRGIYPCTPARRHDGQLVVFVKPQ